MNLTIHIGLHKTGSTYIQNTLRNNYSNLIQEGFLFPKTGFVKLEERGGEPNTSAGHDLFVKAALTHDRRFKNTLIQSLRNEINATNPANILISAENFTNHLLGDISKKTYALLGGVAPARILISLRNPYEWVDSYYRDRVTSGWEFENLSLSKFIRKHQTILDYAKIIRQWKNSFGNDNVDIIIYGDTLKRAGLVNTYRDHLGIQYNLAATETPLVNESASDNFVNSALIFNKKALPTITARNILTEFKKSGLSKGSRTALLDNSDINFIEKQFRRWNSDIETLNFITGSFAELCRKPEACDNKEQCIDFSKELISAYKNKKLHHNEYIEGISKFIISFMPIKLQVITRRLWVGFSRTAH
jgi:hypothetical protein